MRIAVLPLVSLLLVLVLACTAETTLPTSTSHPVTPPTVAKDPNPTPVPTVPTLSPTSSLASSYDIEESRIFTIQELGEAYVQQKRGERSSRSIAGEPILTEGCHVGDSIKLGEDLYIAFSPDGKLDLKDNVILVTGFDVLPESKACYEMVLIYKGVRRVTINFNPAELQRFRLVDDGAISSKK